MKGRNFQIDELELKNDGVDEQLRTREIFERLKQKAINHEPLTEHEKNFFCLAIKISQMNDGAWEDYTCCDNFKFKYLYLTYLFGLAGGKIYYKPEKGKMRKVEISEANSDLDYLNEVADEWETIIKTQNHSEQVLQQISIETRQELKELANQPEFTNNPYAKGTRRYKHKFRVTLLHSKFIYCTALEIFEAIDPHNLILKINCKQIEFTEYSIIHILNRHFAEKIKQFDTGKSFHNEYFKPRELSLQLKEIFDRIDNSKLLAGKPINKIAFQYQGIDYLMWTSEKLRQVKGKDDEIYNRVETFYPLSDLIERDKLNSKYNFHKIDSELYVYVPI